MDRTRRALLRRMPLMGVALAGLCWSAAGATPLIATPPIATAPFAAPDGMPAAAPAQERAPGDGNGFASFAESVGYPGGVPTRLESQPIAGFQRWLPPLDPRTRNLLSPGVHPDPGGTSDAAATGPREPEGPMIAPAGAGSAPAEPSLAATSLPTPGTPNPATAPFELLPPLASGASAPPAPATANAADKPAEPAVTSQDKPAEPAVASQDKPAETAGTPQDKPAETAGTPQPPADAIAPRSEGLELVAQEADRHSRRGFELAGRGAWFAARAEFIVALRLLTQGLDADGQTAIHSQALAAALTALRECEDFIPRGGRLEADLDVPEIIRAHRTPVLQNTSTQRGTSLEALRCYLTYAQEQFAVAGGREVAASMALHGLGKLHASMTGQTALRVVSPEAKAMAFYQAALLVFPRNYMVSNELGVLLARCGRYGEARIALEHSLSIRPQATGWYNLSVVYRHLGETDLASRADRLAQTASQIELASRAGSPPPSAQDVRWVDSRAFVQSCGGNPGTQGPSPSTPAEMKATARRPADNNVQRMQ